MRGGEGEEKSRGEERGGREGISDSVCKVECPSL